MKSVYISRPSQTQPRLDLMRVMTRQSLNDGDPYQEQMMSLRTAVLPVQKGSKRTISDKAQARADAKAEEVVAAAEIQASQSKPLAPEVPARNPGSYVWDFAKDIEGKTYKLGEFVNSNKFTLLGVPDLLLSLYPKGMHGAEGQWSAAFLHAPAGWQIRKRMTLGGEVYEDCGVSIHEAHEVGQGCWFAPINAGSTKLAVELLEVIPPISNAA